LLLTADIDKTFRGGVNVKASLHIPDDALVTILFGPSGSGKTTVLRCISGLEKLDTGKVVFKSRDWTKLPPQRRPVGFLFQDYALFPHLRVRENIAYGAQGRVAIVDRVAAMLKVVDVLDRKPSELSGGQQQRVALARVLAREPELLLLDEPLSALDAATRDHVRSETAQLLRTLRIPAIVVTHDWVDALTLGDWMAVMNRGRILQTGVPQEVFTKPQHREVAAAVGVETVVTGRMIDRAGGVATLQVGTARLAAADPGGEAIEYYVCIRSEDVTLEKGRADQSSARNHLKGVVAAVVPVGVLTRVIVDVGFELVALVTRQAVEDLDLVAGAEVFAVLKA
jgi:molybdate transport system ATP-binding protein